MNKTATLPGDNGEAFKRAHLEGPDARTLADLLTRSNAFAYSLDYGHEDFHLLTRGMERMLGYNHLAWQELGLDALRAALHPDDRACLREIQKKILSLTLELSAAQRLQISFAYCLRVQAAGGRTLTLSFHQVFTSFHPDGTPRRDFVVVTDVSYLKRQPHCVLQARLQDDAGDRIYRSVTFHTKPKVKFSPREIDVLKLVARGLSSKEIAEELYISYNTVSTHRKKLMKKAGVKKALDLVSFARDQGLIEG